MGTYVSAVFSTPSAAADVYLALGLDTQNSPLRMWPDGTFSVELFKAHGETIELAAITGEHYGCGGCEPTPDHLTVLGLEELIPYRHSIKEISWC